MSFSKVKRGDKVKVISGNFKGTIGKVISVKSTKDKKRIALDTIPLIAKYRKAYSYQGESYPGEKFLVNRFIDVSNVQILDENDKLTRVRIGLENGKKVRLFVSTGSKVRYTHTDIVQEKSKHSATTTVGSEKTNSKKDKAK